MPEVGQCQDKRCGHEGTGKYSTIDKGADVCSSARLFLLDTIRKERTATASDEYGGVWEPYFIKRNTIYTQ